MAVVFRAEASATSRTINDHIIICEANKDPKETDVARENLPKVTISDFTYFWAIVIMNSYRCTARCL